MELILLLLIIVVIWLSVRAGKFKKQFEESEKKAEDIAKKAEETNTAFEIYKQYTAHLHQYEAIDDAKIEAERIIDLAQTRLKNAEADVQRQLAEAKDKGSALKERGEQALKEARIRAVKIEEEAKVKGNTLKERGEQVLKDAHVMASKIETEAKAKAAEIAGEAWKAKENAELYTATAKAMKNIIEGYGDNYLIPNQTLLDDLAEEYDHKQAGEDLKLIRSQIKSMLKNNQAAVCEYVEANRKQTAVNFVIDAFNGKVDSLMAQVRHDNYGKLLQKLEDAYNIVNNNGKAFRDARITQTYYDLMVQQLKAAVIVQEIKRQDLDEQRRIREVMREEERVRQEYEKALKEAEKQEKILQKAMKEVEAKLANAVADEKQLYEEQIRELEAKLRESEEKGQRAISMAQQTKQGHVYIISNIGSSGEEIFKIGMTRRLEPLERVKELGDASVPFSFDVHAMIYAEDAPKLEKELHTRFFDKQLNKINPRKEFFRVPLTEIKQEIEGLGLNTHWTMKAEALEYRESLQLSGLSG